MKAYASSNVICSNCFWPLTTSSDFKTLTCRNDTCKSKGIHYKMPTVELERVEDKDRRELKGYACPKCGSSDVSTERRIDGNSSCIKCDRTDKTDNFNKIYR